jgi:hypothetical protein
VLSRKTSPGPLDSWGTLSFTLMREGPRYPMARFEVHPASTHVLHSSTDRVLRAKVSPLVHATNIKKNIVFFKATKQRDRLGEGGSQAQGSRGACHTSTIATTPLPPIPLPLECPCHPDTPWQVGGRSIPTVARQHMSRLALIARLLAW